MARMELRLPDTLRDAISKAAREQDLSVSDFIRLAAKARIRQQERSKEAARLVALRTRQ